MDWLRLAYLEARRRGWLRPRFLLKSAAMAPLYAVAYGLVAVGYPFMVLSLAVAFPLLFLFNLGQVRKDPKQLVWVVLGPAKMAALFFPFFAIPYLALSWRPAGPDFSLAQPHVAAFLIGTALCSIVWALVAYGPDVYRKLALAMQITGTSTSRIRSMAAGLVELRGKVRAFEGASHAVRFTTHYQPDTTSQEIALFTLDDGTGKAVVDAREAFVQPRWGTGNGEHVREIYLTRRVKPHSLTEPEVQELLTGDEAYVLGYYDPEETMEAGGETLPVIRPRNNPAQAQGWRRVLSSQGARENWSFAHAFLLTDGDERTAVRAALRASFASLVRSVAYVIPAVIMLTQVSPFVMGYDRWTVTEIERFAPAERRTALLTDRARKGDAAALHALAARLDDPHALAVFPALAAAAPASTATWAVNNIPFERVKALDELRPLIDQTYLRAPVERRTALLWTLAQSPLATKLSPEVLQDALTTPALQDEALRAVEYAKAGHPRLEPALETLARAHTGDYRVGTAASILRRSRGADGTVRFLLSLAADPPPADLVCAVASQLPVSVSTDVFFASALRSGADDRCVAPGLAVHTDAKLSLPWFAARLTSASWTASTHAHAAVRQAAARARPHVEPHLTGYLAKGNSDTRLAETLAIVFDGNVPGHALRHVEAPAGR